MRPGALDSMNAFILRFAGLEGFLLSARAGLKTINALRGPTRSAMQPSFVSKLGAVSSLSLLCVCPTSGASIHEDFSTAPENRGWSAWGQSELFSWNATQQNLAVTWDSSKSNSFFYVPLGVTVSSTDDFSFSFDLVLTDAVAGLNPQKPYTFQIAIGLLNLARAKAPGFNRATGSDSPNVVDFGYFPDPGGSWIWGPSLTASMIDWTGTNWGTGGFAPLGLTTGDLFRISLSYSASQHQLRTVITKNGQAFGPIDDTSFGTNFLGFALDAFAVCSYSDAGQDPFYAGSLLAHGTIDNVTLSLPDPVARFQGTRTGSTWSAQFQSRSHYNYWLEKTVDLNAWLTVDGPVSGNGGSVSLQDTNAVLATGFYRVRATKQ